MTEEKKPRADALSWTYDEFIAKDPESIAIYQEERIKMEIARQAYDLREAAGLSQKELADLIGITETDIDDLEEADYEGNYMQLLVRIAVALKKSVDVSISLSGSTGPDAVSSGC